MESNLDPWLAGEWFKRALRNVACIYISAKSRICHKLNPQSDNRREFCKPISVAKTQAIFTTLGSGILNRECNSCTNSRKSSLWRKAGHSSVGIQLARILESDEDRFQVSLELNIGREWCASGMYPSVTEFGLTMTCNGWELDNFCIVILSQIRKLGSYLSWSLIKH